MENSYLVVTGSSELENRARCRFRHDAQLFIFNDTDHERISKWSELHSAQVVEQRAAVSVGMCSLLLCINSGKVEPHDYTSQIIDKVKAVV